MLDRAPARHPYGRQTKTRQHNFYFASNQIFKDLRNGTRDPFGKRIPCRPRKPFGQSTLQNAHKDDLIQKLWEPERTTSDGGLETTVGFTHYRVLLPSLPCRARTTVLAYIVYTSKPWPAWQVFFISSC